LPFFFEEKRVKSGSIEDTDLTSGWEVQPTTGPLPGFHTDVSATVVSRTMWLSFRSRKIEPGMCLHPRPVHYHWTTRPVQIVAIHLVHASFELVVWRPTYFVSLWFFYATAYFVLLDDVFSYWNHPNFFLF